MLPTIHFLNVSSRCDQLAGLYAYLQQTTTGVLELDELLRAEWVMRVSALDLYIHELIAQRLLLIFEGQLSSPPAFSRFQVSTDTLRRIKAATSDFEASAAFDLEVRGQLGRITYQFPEDIAAGVRLCSPVELWNEIAVHQGATQQEKGDTAKSLKRQLSLFVRRRNAIAHEGDLQQGPVRTPYAIDISDLQSLKSFISDLVTSIEAVV